jgi:hypothetical protein
MKKGWLRKSVLLARDWGIYSILARLSASVFITEIANCELTNRFGRWTAYGSTFQQNEGHVSFRGIMILSWWSMAADQSQTFSCSCHRFNISGNITEKSATGLNIHRCWWSRYSHGRRKNIHQQSDISSTRRFLINMKSCCIPGFLLA